MRNNKVVGILLFFALNLFFSCISAQNPVFLDLLSTQGGHPSKGKISHTAFENDRFLIFDENDSAAYSIRFKGEPLIDLQGILEKSATYEYRGNFFPDGPIESLILSDNRGITLFLGDGLRSGKIDGTPLEVKEIPSRANKMYLISEGESRILTVGEESSIEIEGETYTAYLLNLIKGSPEFDQPPFQIDLMLIRR